MSQRLVFDEADGVVPGLWNGTRVDDMVGVVESYEDVTTSQIWSIARQHPDALVCLRGGPASEFAIAPSFGSGRPHPQP